MRKVLIVFFGAVACVNIGCLQSNTNKSSKESDDSVAVQSSSVSEARSDDELSAESTSVVKENISGEEVQADEKNHSSVKGKLNQSKSLELFTHLDRFGNKTRRDMEDRGFKQYHLMTTIVIDPDGDEEFNEDAVERYLNSYFPERDAGGLCVIDWEKKKYMDLKKDAESDEFKIAEQHFIELIRFVKSKRPNLQIGFYGVPFRIFTNRYPQYGRKDKFKKLLSECDVITPSLYSKFTDEEIGEAKNKLYLENNIKNGVEYANALQKPLYFFVWEVVQDNQNDRRLMPIDEFKRQIELVVKYQGSNSLIKGVIYWTPYNPDTFYKNITSPVTNSAIRSATINNNQSKTNVRDIRDGIVSDYLNNAF